MISRHRHVMRFAVILALAGASACAPALTRPPSPAEVEQLEARVARDSSDYVSLVSLGSAYRLLDRPATPLLERAVAMRPGDLRVALQLGIAYEEEGRIAEATSLYARYLEQGGSRSLRRHLEGRIRVLHLRQLVDAARDAVAREQELASTAPRPATVAVFPFLMQMTDTTLRPLGRAIAELLVTDLSQTDRLTVLERLQVQTLLGEMSLADQGLVDPATAARSGRMLGAGQIVQGSVGGNEANLALNAAVVAVRTGQPEVQSARTNTTIQRLFDAEKGLALELYRVLGVELTQAERERINRRQTENVMALLHLGIGLEAEDAGAWATAGEHHRQALSFDGDFALARQHAEAAERAAEASLVSTDELWRMAEEEDVDPLAEVQLMVPDASGRDAVAEMFGREGVVGARGSIIRVILQGGGRVILQGGGQ